MRVICPACGCNLEPVPGVPLGVVACPDCGQRIDLRRPAMAAGARPAIASSPLVRRPGYPWLVGAAVGVVAAGVAVTTALLGRPKPPVPTVAMTMPWDQSHRGELLSAKTAADAAALRGELRAAYDGYGRVMSVAAEHGVADPVALQVVAAARAGQDRVFAAMLADRPAGPTAVATAAPPLATTAPVAVTALGAALRLPTMFATTRSAPATAPTPAVATGEPPNPADVAPPVARPPPLPHLHPYAAADAVTDEQIGTAMDRGVTFLAGRFRRGQVVTGLESTEAAAANAMPIGVPVPKVPKATGAARPAGADPEAPASAAGGSDLDGGSGLGELAPSPPPGRAGGGRVGGGRVVGGSVPPPSATPFSTPGIDALCVYALLHAGQATGRRDLRPDDPAVAALLDRLKGYDLGFTYHRSLRAAALAVYARPQDRQALEDDVAWLLAAGGREGSYTYTLHQRGDGGTWDNSNSQYGLLGVWSAAQAGVAVPPAYWRAVERHWTRCGDPHGVWAYGPGGAGGPTLTMTCAGVASLLVARDYLDDAGGNGTGLLARAADRASASPLADAGLDRLDTGDNCVNGLYHNESIGGVGYGLYGLERVGLASGFKYFGKHDWYAELAAHLVAEQRPDGSWGNDGSPPADAEVHTAYCLLFLARGRHPVLFNKLRYPGDWDGRPHDVAHLATFAGHRLERPLNWQVVNLRRDGTDWLDAPVLYVAGDKPPALADADYDALRQYAMAGGLIFTHADGGSPSFNVWVARLVRRLFPDDPLVRLPKDHPLNAVLYRLADGGPPLEGVSNGSRLLLVHSPTDIAGGWHLNWTDERAADFQAGLNVFVYAAGKTDYNNRLATTAVPPPPDAAATTAVARLRYAGGRWDPEPAAWPRFARAFQWETHQGLDVRTVDLASLRPGDVPLAVLTGTDRHDFTPAEAAAARAFVAAGGVLLVDACGGRPPFAQSVRASLVPAAFPGAALSPLPDDHPLRVPARPFAEDLRGKLPLRPFAVERLGTSAVPLEGLHVGRGWVVFSPVDLTTGLLGTDSWGLVGYQPAYAAAVARNAVLWAAAQAAATNR